jgi:succinoglycan biosynthesis protein ExoA
VEVERQPSVTIAIPTLNEEARLAACLQAVAEQDYPNIIEVVIADGGSTDRTREIALGSNESIGHDWVRIVDNPRRIRPAGLNVALEASRGEIWVRVDARTLLAPDYVSRAVEALRASGAAVVGGPLRLSADSPRQRGIAAAMTSRLGAGPAAFRREGGEARFVDTVYLGAFWTEGLRKLGGYDDVFGGNEDAELNHRAQEAGGVFLDPRIVSSYAVREGFAPLWRQYRRYGRARAGTMRKHPSSVRARQLAVPLLVLGLLSPWRRPVFLSYTAAVLGRGAVEAVADPAAAPTMVLALPVMHMAWAVGFFEAMVLGRNMTMEGAG